MGREQFGGVGRSEHKKKRDKLLEKLAKAKENGLTNNVISDLEMKVKAQQKKVNEGEKAVAAFAEANQLVANRAAQAAVNRVAANAAAREEANRVAAAKVAANEAQAAANRAAAAQAEANRVAAKAAANAVGNIKFAEITRKKAEENQKARQVLEQRAQILKRKIQNRRENVAAAAQAQEEAEAKAESNRVAAARIQQILKKPYNSTKSYLESQPQLPLSPRQVAAKIKNEAQKHNLESTETLMRPDRELLVPKINTLGSKVAAARAIAATQAATNTLAVAAINAAAENGVSITLPAATEAATLVETQPALATSIAENIPQVVNSSAAATESNNSGASPTQVKTTAAIAASPSALATASAANSASGVTAGHPSASSSEPRVISEKTISIKKISENGRDPYYTAQIIPSPEVIEVPRRRGIRIEGMDGGRRRTHRRKQHKRTRTYRR